MEPIYPHLESQRLSKVLHDIGEIDRTQFGKDLKNAGRTLILSDGELSEQEAYEVIQGKRYC